MDQSTMDIPRDKSGDLSEPIESHVLTPELDCGATAAHALKTRSLPPIDCRHGQPGDLSVGLCWTGVRRDT